MSNSAILTLARIVDEKQHRQSGFKTGGVGDSGEKISIFFRQFHQNNRFFRSNFRKISIFSGNFTKKVRFLKANFRRISIFRQFNKIFYFLGKCRFLYRQFQTKYRFFRANFRKISIFSGNFTKKFDFSRLIFEEFRFLGNFTRNFDFSGKNSLFTAIPG